jgi:hypothetical protein
VTTANPTKNRLYELPTAWLTDTDPVLEDSGQYVSIWFTYYDPGREIRTGLRFTTPRAYRWRAEGHSTVWHMEGAYDILVEVVDSEWVRELKESQMDETPWTIRHFLIYIEDSGAYEIAAESWSLLPEESVP